MDENNALERITKFTVTERLNKGFDSVICITGRVGRGKSTLAIKLAEQIAKRAKVPFDLEENIIYDPNPKDVKAKIWDLPEGSPVILDEGIRALYKRNWWTEENKFLVQMFNICRKKKKAIMICTPFFRQIDDGVRNERVNLWIDLLDRGVAIAHVPADSQYMKDPWMVEQTEREIRKWLATRRWAGLHPDEYHKFLRTRKSFYASFTFTKLPGEMEKEYLKHVEKHSQEIKMPDSARGARLRLYETGIQSLMAWMYTKYDVKQWQIAEASGLMPGTVNRLLQKAGIKLREVRANKRIGAKD